MKKVIVFCGLTMVSMVLLVILMAGGQFSSKESSSTGLAVTFNGEYTEDLLIFEEIKGRGPITDEYEQAAVGTSVKYRLLPSVILSQLGWESAYVKSASGRNDTNFLGITWFPGCPYP